ncbi:arsenite methyltransferase [Cellulomonas sp. NPDC055163]
MTEDLVEQVRRRYAEAALAVTRSTAPGGAAPGGAAPGGAAPGGGACCAPDGAGVGADTHAQAEATCCGPTQARETGDRFGGALYDVDDAAAIPEAALLASLGCGNPTAVADLRPGERVLDLGSGGGIDVLLSARRVGPTGFAYGVDMTPEMLDLARSNAATAGATNVEFLEGRIEALPLPDAAVDVVISNCVVNLSVDKPAVLAEVFRVLAPGGRVGISDVVADDDVTPEQRGERGSHVGCIAGALSRREYLDGLTAAGFTDASVTFTHEVAPGLHGAIVRAVKP